MDVGNIKRLPKPLMDNYDWQLEGACRSSSPDQFFFGEAERGKRRMAREAAAKALCATCPVVQACLAHALKVREPYGVWGGTTPEEREVMVRRQAAV
ncbi:WhiB family transcriptional regulator [Phycicoccus sp. M110.8]|jgi:WhiB family redox-sensing transcriptional regulator|uniref:WhiB family transcriptional regulator n=1 Tax=Phycicoccus sp. M110.8 TaxID=3075433 RepID=UPI0028FD57AB|nr:WhiB family transcriptional regulator [Phycicoccus sp. M110.8]MDU0315557.1 WhiB family transcriptional regulator [Phycicoccus sp. M110.8]